MDILFRTSKTKRIIQYCSCVVIETEDKGGMVEFSCCLRYFRHSSQTFTQYLVSVLVFCGTASIRLLCISGSLTGAAKRVCTLVVVLHERDMRSIDLVRVSLSGKRVSGSTVESNASVKSWSISHSYSGNVSNPESAKSRA